VSLQATYPDDATVGTTSISSPTLIGPSTSVPVTTVPKPLIVNTRSMGRRGRPESGRAGDFSSNASRGGDKIREPSRLGAEILITGAPSREVPCSAVTTSAETSSSHSLSTKVDLGQRDQATPHLEQVEDLEVLPRLRHHASSAATTNITASRPCTPASMLRMNRACPGTSTMPISRPLAGHVRKPQIDRHATALFFGQAVGIDPGQRVTSVDLP